MSPKVVETQSIMEVVDDAVNLAQQIGKLINVEIDVRIFNDLRPMLETLGN